MGINRMAVPQEEADDSAMRAGAIGAVAALPQIVSRIGRIATSSTEAECPALGDGRLRKLKWV